MCQAFERQTISSVERQPHLDLSIQVTEKCKQSGVAVFVFPPYCSHKLQPRDRSVKGSLTTYVIRAFDACITKHPGTAKKLYDIPCAVNTPFLQTACKYQNTFPGSGIYPFSWDIF